MWLTSESHFLVSLVFASFCLVSQISAQCQILRLDKKQQSLDTLNELPKGIRNQAYSTKAENSVYSFHICPDTGVVRDFGAVFQTDSKNKTIILGRKNESDVQISPKGDLMNLVYTKGDNYQNACNKSERRAIITIRCLLSESEPSFNYLSENVADQEDFCVYLFELIVPPAYLEPVLKCGKPSEPKVVTTATLPPVATADSKKVSDDNSHAHHLSVGSIILILILVPTVFFFILGALYKRFVMGAHGIEQMPFIDFWRNCGTLQAAGWRYVTNRGRSPRNTYDDYSAVSTEEEREVFDAGRTNDDHLLPM